MEARISCTDWKPLQFTVHTIEFDRLKNLIKKVRFIGLNLQVCNYFSLIMIYNDW